MIRLLALLLLVACGSASDEPTTSNSTGGEDGRCPSELSECYDEGSRAQCLQVAETCAPENIVTLRSCPAQYECQNNAVTSDVDEPTSEEETCAGYRASDSCMNEENFAECLAAEAECPGSVAVMESCPLQFACDS